MTTLLGGQNVMLVDLFFRAEFFLQGSMVKTLLCLFNTVVRNCPKRECFPRHIYFCDGSAGQLLILNIKQQYFYFSVTYYQF